MKIYVYEIKSSNKIHLKQLHNELNLIISKYLIESKPSTLQILSGLNLIILTTENEKLVDVLLASKKFILKDAR